MLIFHTGELVWEPDGRGFGVGVALKSAKAES